ncbi:hypothetical protein [Paraburkholderia dinghuensis]|uniref:Uncharacterized protein n=1 Tax=Paraburkholderia dinghuensis TaxID=2305225 RepID=A0A3N6NEQ8_9BURK|nr:hypothetical protein [Paraburkholderia dinghuensis]RQH07057.1 hypothetical protein D1Y85_10325 [Paraburkholderia dinghuensis]
MEVLLNCIGALTWEWRWWNLDAPWLIWLIGYMPFFMVAGWVHDMPSLKRQIGVVKCARYIRAGRPWRICLGAAVDLMHGVCA